MKPGDGGKAARGVGAQINQKHLGSDFDDFLREHGLLAGAEAVAAKRVQAYLIATGDRPED